MKGVVTKVKTTYRCRDPLCGLRKPYNMLKYYYYPTFEDSPTSLKGVIKTFCDRKSCQPMPSKDPHFTIDFRTVKAYNHLIDEDYSKLPAEVSEETGNILDLKKYDIDYEYSLIELKDTLEDLESRVISYQIPNREIALFLASLCGLTVGRGDMIKAITKCIEYMMEREKPAMAIPEPPEESPEPYKPRPRKQKQLHLASNPDLIDWDALFPK